MTVGEALEALPQVGPGSGLRVADRRIDSPTGRRLASRGRRGLRRSLHLDGILGCRRHRTVGFGHRPDRRFAVIGLRSGLEDTSRRTVPRRALATGIATRVHRAAVGIASMATTVRPIMSFAGLLGDDQLGVGRVRLAGPLPPVPLLLLA